MKTSTKALLIIILSSVMAMSTANANPYSNASKAAITDIWDDDSVVLNIEQTGVAGSNYAVYIVVLEYLHANKQEIVVEEVRMAYTVFPSGYDRRLMKSTYSAHWTFIDFDATTESFPIGY